MPLKALELRRIPIKRRMSIHVLVREDGSVFGEDCNLLNQETPDARPLVMVGGTQRRVEDLVAEAFLGHRERGVKLIHKDGNLLNNAASNLEYVEAV